MKPIRVLLLVSLILLCEVVGGIGSIFTIEALPTWYASLIKPVFTPPGWVFAPVWTTLYLLMGISLYLIISKRSARNKLNGAISAFGIQLALNCLWSIVFFGTRSTFGGLVVIVALLAAISVTILKFWRTSHTASLLLAPYLAWVVVAASLNLFVWLLNP